MRKRKFTIFVLIIALIFSFTCFLTACAEKDPAPQTPSGPSQPSNPGDGDDTPTNPGDNGGEDGGESNDDTPSTPTNPDGGDNNGGNGGENNGDTPSTPTNPDDGDNPGGNGSEDNGDTPSTPTNPDNGDNNGGNGGEDNGDTPSTPTNPDNGDNNGGNTPTPPAEPEPPAVDPDDPDHTHDYVKTENGNTFTYKCTCNLTLDGYRIQFVYAEDGSQADEGIEVSWMSGNNAVRTATTDAMGYVEALDLPGDSYTIEVDESTLPVIDGVNYLYNTNAFSTQTNGVGLIIPLMGVHQPSNENASGVTGRLESTEDRFAISLNKTYIATLNSATDEIWYTVQNENFGKYTVDATMAGDMTVEITRHAANIAYVSEAPDTNVDASVKNKLTYTVVYTDRNQDSTFCMKVADAASYPVNIPFSVTITYQPPNNNVGVETLVKPTHFKSKNATYKYYTEIRGTGQRQENTTRSLAPHSTVTPWPDSEGSVINDLTETQLNAMQLKDDDFYYVNNQLVFVKLDTPSIFESFTLANYLENSGHLSIYQVTAYDEYGCCTRWDNYFGFIQAYTALANSDGLYPLTDEMYSYLQYLARKEHQPVQLLLCTYPKQTKSWTQGNGTEATPYAVTLEEQYFGNYNVSIAAGGKVYVTLNGTMDVELTYNANVKATIGSTLYEDEYLTVDGSVTLVFESKNGEALDFVLKIVQYDDPYYLEIGTNETIAIPRAEVNYEFIAPTAGTYDISVSTNTVTVTAQQVGEDDVIINGVYTVTLAEGESLCFVVETEDTMEIPFTIVIAENTLE